MEESERQAVENAAKLLTEMVVCSATGGALAVESSQINSIAHALVGVASAHRSARGYPTVDDLKVVPPLSRMWPDKTPEEIIAMGKATEAAGG